jgi:dihydroorotate dehydrogenase electron transfer subunit
MKTIDLRHTATVVSNTPICADHYLLALEEEMLPKVTLPGQFVNIRIPNRADLLLRRPFSVARVKPEKSQFEIVYRVVGQGTAAMTDLQPGDGIDLLGPLGKEFTIPELPMHCLLIGGGCGVAPLWAVSDRLSRTGSKITALLGFQSSETVFGEDEFRANNAEVVITTDDGSYGLKGFVSAHLESLLDRKFGRVYGCGPLPMLKAVAPILKQAGVPGEVSLEARMGCGFGVCLSCVVSVRDDESIEKHRVCTEGSVFNLKDILLDHEG